MLTELRYELSRGFAYRGICHRGMRTYTTWLPLLLTILALLIYAVLPVQPALAGSSSLSGSLLTLVSTLPGFYFAGLAAVSTFGNATMDQEMPAPPPKINILVHGKPTGVPLTRRLFLTYLFSYLVILSFLLCFSFIILVSFVSSIESFKNSTFVWSGSYWPWISIKFLIGFAITFGFSSMIVSTLHGVFFLTEKIHQP